MSRTLSSTLDVLRPTAIGNACLNAINHLRGKDADRKRSAGRAALIMYNRGYDDVVRNFNDWRGPFLLRCFDALHGDRDPALTLSPCADLALDTRSIVSGRLFALRRIHNLSHVEIGLLLIQSPDMICAWEMNEGAPTNEEAEQVAALENLVSAQYARPLEGHERASKIP